VYVNGVYIIGVLYHCSCELCDWSGKVRLLPDALCIVIVTSLSNRKRERSCIVIHGHFVLYGITFQYLFLFIHSSYLNCTIISCYCQEKQKSLCKVC
jgi:hypothetical protein